MSRARPPLSPSQLIWVEGWDGRDACGKCQRPIGLDAVAGAGTVLDVQWCVVQGGCAWDGVVLGWALSPRSVGYQREVLAVVCWGCTTQEGLMDWMRPEGPCQAGEMEALWRSTKLNAHPALGWNNPRHQYVLGAAWARMWLDRKCLGCAGGHQVEHKPSVCPRDEANSLWCCIASRVSREFFLSTQPWKATAGVVGSAIGSQNRRWAAKKDHKNTLM